VPELFDWTKTIDIPNADVEKKAHTALLLPCLQ
jgi:hypothetical protein